jgi:hypothetical protein
MRRSGRLELMQAGVALVEKAAKEAAAAAAAAGPSACAEAEFSDSDDEDEARWAGVAAVVD